VLTRNHQQEALCRAYVRAVAARAGLSVSEPEVDYGVDLSLRAITLKGKRRRDVGPQLDLQLKSTTRADVGETSLRYDLDVKNYEDLREGHDLSPCLLVVLVLPNEEERWLGQSPEELVLRHCAYWLSLRGSPPTTATRSVRLTIPLTSIFSVAALQEIFQRLLERKGP
jgi:hypothetical protein